MRTRTPSTHVVLRSTAWVLAAVGVTAPVVGVVWAAQAGRPMTLPWMVCIAGSAVGLLIVTKRPRNRLGWMILVVCAVMAACVAMEGYWYAFGLDAGEPSRLAVWAWWTAQVVPAAGFFFFAVVLPFLFPTGEIPSRRWKWLVWYGGAAYAVYQLLWLSAPRLCPLPLDVDAIPLSPTWECTDSIASPVVVLSGSLRDVILSIWLPMLVVAAVAAIASMFDRYAQAGVVERAQMRWFSLAAMISIALLIGADLVGAPGLVGHLAYLVVPVAIALAVLRYRLYDIDKIVSRTISYTIVVGVLAAVYGGLVTLLSRVVPLNSSIAVAASTLASAALLNPARRRVQSAVDARFNRTRYVAGREYEEFLRRRQEATGPEIAQELLAVTQRTLGPSTIGLWLTGTGGHQAHANHPSP